MLLLILLAAVDCGALTDPANGTVDVSITTFGSTATYTCETGYNLNGTADRMCNSSGSWTPGEPLCDGTYKSFFLLRECLLVFFCFSAVDCGPLGNPADGLVVILSTTTTFGSIAIYNCTSGYNLTGEATRVCQADGVWNSSDPTCPRK